MKQSGRPLTMLLFLLPALWLGLVFAAGAAELPLAEAPLNPEGRMFEVNLDDQGFLWLADLDADEVWHVDRDTGAYTIFAGIPDPSDARRAPDGTVWWGELNQGRIGRLQPDTGALTWWPTPGSAGNYGVNFDAGGHVWVTGDPEQLFSFDPATGRLCTYEIPDSGSSDYVLAGDDTVWLGDRVNGRLYRLTPSAAQFTYWELPVDSTPRGLALTATGALWYADSNLGLLGRLRPEQDELTVYDPPRGSLVQRVAVAGDLIWYTEQLEGTVGNLDPAVAVGATGTVARGTVAATPDCDTQTPVATATATTAGGWLRWTSATYTSLVDAGGWRIFEMPSQALPDGIAGDGARVWFADPGRQVLGRIDDDAAVSPLLQAAVANADDLALSWSAHDVNCTYDLLARTDPYGGETVAAQDLTDTGYVVAGVVGDPGTNHYYAVQAQACTGQTTARSNWIGAFDFALQPGS